MLFLGIFIMLLSSCENLLSNGDGEQGHFPSSPQYRTFKAQNLVHSVYYNVQSQLLYEGVKCNVWGELSSNVSPNTAKRLANSYDNTIFPKMMSAFSSGEPIYEDGKIVANNPVEYASWLVDGDKKLTILLLDILDGYTPNSGFVGGYFSGADLLSSSIIQYSNEEAMIYLDTNPGQPGSSQSNGFLAHEMQHLMNFAVSVAKRSNRNPAGQILFSSIKFMDLWIDEGLSTAAEWVWSEEQEQNRVGWYAYDMAGTIARGNNFFVWDNYKYDNRSIMDEYSTAYIFFQWLRVQSGGTGIYKEIVNSIYADYRAVTISANKVMGGQGYYEWDTLLKTWLAANYINAPSGKYGYKNEALLRNIKAKTLPSGTKTINLYPGEGVYSITDAAFLWPGQGANIKYAGLTGSTPWLSDESTFPDGALLTFNVNTNTEGIPESGKTTGVAADISMNAGSMNAGSINNFPGLSRSAVLNGPYPIGAGDLLRRNGHKKVSVPDLIKIDTESEDLE